MKKCSAGLFLQAKRKKILLLARGSCPHETQLH